MAKRYYAQWDQQRQGWAWVVYDRMHTDEDQEPLAIGVFRNRLYAFRTRDALNKADI